MRRVRARVCHRLGLHQRGHLLGVRVRNRILADHRDRRRVAPADARRVQDANARTQQDRQLRQQRARAGHLAGDRVADAHGDGGRRCVALLDHVEMVIERRHLVDFGHRQLHLGRERDKVRRGQAAEAVLNPVQVLDQQIPPAWEIAEKGAHVFTRFRLDAPALRRGRARA